LVCSIGRVDIRLGHASFLVQMDGVNILTDPIWSHRYLSCLALTLDVLRSSGLDRRVSHNHHVLSLPFHRSTSSSLASMSHLNTSNPVLTMTTSTSIPSVVLVLISRTLSRLAIRHGFRVTSPNTSTSKRWIGGTNMLGNIPLTKRSR
jgi:hypothetical protein